MTDPGPTRKRLPKPLRWLLASLLVVGFFGWFVLLFYEEYVVSRSSDHPNYLTGQIARAAWKSITVYVLPWQVGLLTWAPDVYAAIFIGIAVIVERWAYPLPKRPSPFRPYQPK